MTPFVASKYAFKQRRFWEYVKYSSHVYWYESLLLMVLKLRKIIKM